MARPRPQAALPKAPSREHPAILEPASSPAEQAATPPPGSPPVSPAQAGVQGPVGEDTVMFSARVARSLRTQVRRYAVNAELSLQAVTEAALREYLNNHKEK